MRSSKKNTSHPISISFVVLPDTNLLAYSFFGPLGTSCVKMSVVLTSNAIVCHLVKILKLFLKTITFLLLLFTVKYFLGVLIRCLNFESMSPYFCVSNLHYMLYKTSNDIIAGNSRVLNFIILEGPFLS